VLDAIGDLPDVDQVQAACIGDVFYGILDAPTEYSSKLRNAPGECDNFRPRHPRPGLSGFKRTAHSSQVRARFTKTPPGSFEPASRFFRLHNQGLANTLRAGTGPDCGSFTAPRPIHPTYSRCITTREGARLATFPDWFDFHPTVWHGFRQLGNAVPPFLARAIAQSLAP
jgi:DNA (cytosine-5)-methyltransferase 1